MPNQFLGKSLNFIINGLLVVSTAGVGGVIAWVFTQDPIFSAGLMAGLAYSGGHKFGSLTK